jgi:hypothetical protein
MANILIGYDLNKAGKDYNNLISAIKGLSTDWWHCLDSTWIIKTQLSTVQVRDALASHIDGNDELLVVDITGDAAAWTGFDTNCSNWLKNNL